MISQVEEAIARLRSKASMVGHTLFKDSVAARQQFMMEVNIYCDQLRSSIRKISRQAEQEIVEAINRAGNYIEKRGWQLASSLIGTVAGGFQVLGGVVLIKGTVGIGTPIGAAMIAHGVTNLYEGGSGIYQSTPVKQ